MSTFPDSRRSGKALDKSNFTQTCNLLSQFLKEKRSSAPLTPLGTEPRAATTMDLLTDLKNSEYALRQNASAMDLLPRFVDNPCLMQSKLSSWAPETPQLTIFYAGKVLVFDAFPPEKATEIMELATKLGSDNSGDEMNSPTAAAVATENSNVVKTTTTAQEAPGPGPHAFGPSDMRYPRRASLLKFLEKRKERVIARGPYQISNPDPNSKHEGASSEGVPEPEVEDQCSKSKRFDLNL